MKKRPLSSSEAGDLRQALQVAVLDALVCSRRWEPGDLVFQGGTSLHLVHGSPRFSEDLDFLVKSSLNLEPVAEAVGHRVGPSPWVPKDARISVTRAKDGRNPHSFDVTLGGVLIMGSVRVRVEMWQAPEAALKDMDVRVAPVRLAAGPGAGAQAFVPAAATREIYADKVFALAARPYLKPRDVFDLHWLVGREPSLRTSVRDMQLRLLTYPSQSALSWLAKAEQRLVELPMARDPIARDLPRWLPSSFTVRAADVDAMVAEASAALAQGMEQMKALS